MVDISLNYESLADAGSMLGSGAVIVMDESTCMVDITLRAARFFEHESCGACTPCRVGNMRMVQLLDKISGGLGSWGDVQILRELGERMCRDSRCGLGQAAALPFLSSLKHFEPEYRTHTDESKCPHGICPMSPAAVLHCPHG